MIRVKVCGITNLKDALCAIEFGASALGFVFYPESKRCVNPHDAGEIISHIPPFVASVGVFVNQEIDYITEAQRLSNFGVCQLHGDESPEYCEQIPFPKIKAIRIGEALDPDILDTVGAYPVDAILFDNYSPEAYGGTGTSFNWDILRDCRPAKPVIISGGLTPENVGEAIALLKPFAVDVSSGVEERPGEKSASKIKKFIEAVRNEN